MVIWLPIGSHISIAAEDIEGKEFMRPYTPITDDNSKDYIDYVIKAGCTASHHHCTLKGSAASVYAFSQRLGGASPFPW